MRICLLLPVLAAAVSAQSLDFEVYRAKVEPIFAKKRPNHARCVVCHSANNSAFRLEPLPPGATEWTDEQSRKNFSYVSKLVVPGNPGASRLLRQPLAHEAGGEEFHSGGRQFTSKDDPDWKTISDWVAAAK